MPQGSSAVRPKNGLYLYLFTYNYDNISLTCSLNEKFFRQIKIETNALYLYFFRKPRNLWDIVEKKLGQPDRPQMTIRHMRIACWIPKATTTNSQICNTDWFPTVTTVTLTRMSVMLYVHWFSSPTETVKVEAVAIYQTARHYKQGCLGIYESIHFYETRKHTY